MTTNESVQSVLAKFEVPENYPHFLFVLPALYVAKSDGKISIKETFSLMLNSIVLKLITNQGQEKKAFDQFFKNKVLQFQSKVRLDDFREVADAINVLLEQRTPGDAEIVRRCIHEMCAKVSETSGPLFREKVLPEEAAMLDKICAYIVNQ